MGLSEFQISKAKPGEKPYKLGDSGGLCLLVKPNSSKLWQQKFQYGGREKTLSQGMSHHAGLPDIGGRKEHREKLSL